MIPAFAIERTQELLYELNELVEHNRVPKAPVFIDSPLAIKATEVYKKYQDYFNKEASYLIKSGDELFKFPGLTLTQSVSQSMAINKISSPKIIIAGSGMSTGGRILFHEKIYLPDSRSCLLMINFQVKGSLGRKILDGAKKVRIFNEDIPVRARIFSIGGYSSHADQQDLYNWLANFSKPIKHIFTVHGEVEASKALVQRIKDHLGVSASVPRLKQVVEL
jgi:metallo-beta-lactamase family protein